MADIDELFREISAPSAPIRVIQNESILELQRTWCTEVNSTVILKYKERLMNEIIEVMAQQQEELDNEIDRLKENGATDEYVYFTLFQMDIERVRYSIARYLRCRLIKIENNLEHILTDLSLLDCLSSHEQMFATRLNNLKNEHFQEIIYAPIQNRIDGQELPVPNDDRLKHAEASVYDMVFCRPRKNIDVQLDNNVVPLEKGDTWMTRFKDVQQFINDDEIDLI